MLCFGALLVMIADLTGIFENFSLKKKPMLFMASNCANCAGVLLMIAGGIIG